MFTYTKAVASQTTIVHPSLTLTDRDIKALRLY